MNHHHHHHHFSSQPCSMRREAAPKATHKAKQSKGETHLFVLSLFPLPSLPPSISISISIPTHTRANHTYSQFYTALHVVVAPSTYQSVDYLRCCCVAIYSYAAHRYYALNC